MSQAPSIIPIPVSCRLTGGTSFPLMAETVVAAGGDPALRGVATQLGKLLGIAVAEQAPTGGNVITLRIDPALAVKLGAEGYALTVTAANVAIRGGGAAGVFYGMQSLRQLLPPDIERFGWRAGGGGAAVPA
ncbi:MAG: glycoside hydrolase family 20 zincin-like fold domain-containing protein, partial [Opitutales bacterium]